MAQVIPTTVTVLPAPLGAAEPAVVIVIQRGKKSMAAGFTDPNGLAILLQQLVFAAQQQWPEWGRKEPTDEG